MKHFKVKGTCVYYDTYIVKDFEDPTIARMFLQSLPPSIDVSDISTSPEIETLKTLVRDFKIPDRMWYSAFDEAYSGYLEPVTHLYSIMKLTHQTSSVYARERGYHDRTLCVSCGYVISIGGTPDMRAMIKMLDKDRWIHKDHGLFISDVHPRNKIQSRNVVSDTLEKAVAGRKKLLGYLIPMWQNNAVACQTVFYRSLCEAVQEKYT